MKHSLCGSLLPLSLAALLAVPGASQDRRPGDPDPAARQRQALEAFRDLQEMMARLAATLARTEPENARVLHLGSRLLAEKRVEEEMARVLEQIREENWDGAHMAMVEVRANLHRLLNLLLNRDLYLKELLEEIERLSAFKERVEEILAEQTDLKETSARAEALEAHMRDIDEARRRLEELADRQKEIRSQASGAGVEPPREELERLAALEGALREDTARMAEALSRLEERDAALKAAEGGEAGTPGEGDGGGAGEGEAGGEAGGEGEGAGGGCGSCSGAAGAAAQSMQQAQDRLSGGAPEAALDAMEQALKELEQAQKALEEMEEEARRKLLSVPFEEEASRQQDTMEHTDRLAMDMEEAGAQPGPDGTPQGTPGTQNVQLAVPRQRSAAGSLKEHRPGEARPDQQEAEDQLEEARQRLEDALAQLRQQLQDEVLRALEERFTAMLARQKEISRETRVVEARRGEALTAPGVLPAATREKCHELGAGEHELAGEAEAALRLLLEEGSTAVFPAVVSDLKAELLRVGDLLKAFHTGVAVQAMQREIEETLEELLDALRQLIDYNDGQGECRSQSGEPPLVPLSAELKMIRSLQRRVNNRTERFDADLPEPARLAEEGRMEAVEISRKQGRVEDLTRKLARRLNREDDDGGR